MPIRSELLDTAILEAYAAFSNVPILDTITVIHPDPTKESKYLIEGYEEATLTLETGEQKVFSPAAFRVETPEVSEEGFQDLTITLDNTDLAASNYLEEILSYRKPIEVVFRPYSADDFTKPQMNPPLSLVLREAAANSFELTAQASFADVVNFPFPRTKFTHSVFPALRG